MYPDLDMLPARCASDFIAAATGDASSLCEVFRFYYNTNWRMVNSLEQSAHLSNGGFDLGKISERGEYLRLLAQQAVFRLLDPILAGGEKSI